MFQHIPNGKPKEGGNHEIRVLIVEDHKLFGDAIRSTLQSKGMRVVGLVATEEAALEIAGREKPELALLDFGLPGADGIQIGKALQKLTPDIKLIAVSALNVASWAGDAMAAGFAGVIWKNTPLNDFVSAVTSVLEGEQIGMRHAVQPVEATPPKEQGARLLAKQLTKREREVLQMLVEGARTEEMADVLTISPNTVRTHVQNILTKLQVPSRLAAATFAVRHGILSSRRDG